MNFLGLIFSFMLPGVIIGGMAVALYYEHEKRRTQRRLRFLRSRRKSAKISRRRSMRTICPSRSLKRR